MNETGIPQIPTGASVTKMEIVPSYEGRGEERKLYSYFARVFFVRSGHQADDVLAVSCETERDAQRVLADWVESHYPRGSFVQERGTGRAGRVVGYHRSLLKVLAQQEGVNGAHALAATDIDPRPGGIMTRR